MALVARHPHLVVLDDVLFDERFSWLLAQSLDNCSGIQIGLREETTVAWNVLSSFGSSNAETK